MPTHLLYHRMISPRRKASVRTPMCIWALLGRVICISQRPSAMVRLSREAPARVRAGAPPQRRCLCRTCCGRWTRRLAGAGALAPADGLCPSNFRCLHGRDAANGRAKYPDDEIQATSGICCIRLRILVGRRRLDPPPNWLGTGSARVRSRSNGRAIRAQRCGSFRGAWDSAPYSDATNLREPKSDARDETTSKVSRFASRFTLGFL